MQPVKTFANRHYFYTITYKMGLASNLAGCSITLSRLRTHCNVCKGEHIEDLYISVHI